MNKIKLHQKNSFYKTAIGILLLFSLSTSIMAFNFSLLFFIKSGIILYCLAFTKAYVFNKQNNNKELYLLFGITVLSKELIFKNTEYISVFKPKNERSFYIKIFKENINLEIYNSRNYKKLISKAELLSSIIDVELVNKLEN